MKRSDIITTFDDTMNALRKAQELLKTENANLIAANLTTAERANKDWASIYDLQQLLILMKRANVTVAELQEWVGDASTIRRGFMTDTTTTQTSLFKS